MNDAHDLESAAGLSRRDLLKDSLAAGVLAAQPAFAAGVHTGVDETIRLGFIGCGGRGTGACRDALRTDGPVKLVAMGDLFADRIKKSLASLTGIREVRDRIDVPEDRQFIGFDAYRKVLEADVDVVLLTTPPHFRPQHYAAAVAAGKHVFMEKPCCVDAPGYRKLLAANQAAKAKKLSVVVGLQRRHQYSYRRAIARIREGAVGKIHLVRTYFNMSGAGHSDRGKPADLSEMEYQIRRWGKFCWLSGDHIVEQAVHEIDVANWIMDAHPLRANGMGGRQVRTGRGNGDIFDHHFVEYEFGDGVRHYCQARQIPGTWTHVSDNVHGEKGMMTLGSGPYGLQGKGRGLSRGPGKKANGRENPYQQEHDHLFASIRGTGPHCFDGDHGADSSMTAILGRMATYSGRVVSWDDAVASELRLAPAHYALDADPPAMPDESGAYPIAMPGATRAL